MELKLVVDIDRITLDDLEYYEKLDKADTLGNAGAAKEILWRFITNPDGEYMREAEAREIIGKLGIGQAAKAMQDFFGKVDELKTAQVPPRKRRR